MCLFAHTHAVGYGRTMNTNEQLIQDFYDAFSRKDHRAMAKAYRDDAIFEDPVFLRLDADHTRAMWRMFCVGGADLTVACSQVKADETEGSARWDATYTFAATGRIVHNVIQARFRFKEGAIAEHKDSFDLYRWTRMALGPIGYIAGWTPAVQNKVRKQAAHRLQSFMKNESTNP